MTTIKQVLALTLALALAATAWAGEQVHHEMKVKVVAEGEDGESLFIDSDDLDFDLAAMQVGENNSIVDKNGRNILVTRTEDGYTFDIDGKTVEMPAFDEFHADKVWVGAHGDGEVDVDVHVIKEGHGASAMDTDSVMIVSGKAIDPSTQQAIRSALESAGHSDVTFLGGDESGDRQVKVVKRIHKKHEVME